MDITDINEYRIEKFRKANEELEPYKCSCGSLSFYVLRKGYVCCSCKSKFSLDQVHPPKY